ncbi:ATP-dependent transcriptional regulator [Raoultella planticola]|uniref:ATP-dependent transcriptional regulator n=1 Tax=Raoultella planticola TaxID=575 RepID=A0A485BQ32_RAOPL|nr:ATP-dependent transcriptional regulator [Raoultella planticola]
MQRIPTLLTLRLEMIDDFCPPDGFSRCYIVLARLAQRHGQTDEMTSLLLHAEGLAVQRGWLRAQAPLLAERIANALHAGDRTAADSLLLRLQGLTLGAEKNDVVSACLTLSQSRVLMAGGQRWRRRGSSIRWPLSRSAAASGCLPYACGLFRPSPCGAPGNGRGR